MHSRRIVEAYEDYNQVRVLKGPLAGVYLSLFLMITLMVLLSATWMGLYIAKRITRPVQRLADGARAIGAGQFDHRIEQETADEFGALVEAFNSMAAELAASQRKLERSRIDLERKNREIEERRRYIETILERVATGVVSVDAAGRVSTLNPAAARLLGLGPEVVGAPVTEVFGREDLQPLAALMRRALGGAAAIATEDVALERDGRELHLAAAATPLQGEDGTPGGAVLVFDDVTPLIRTQRVAAWRDVARRLAHEIKNPLTPIQLCAERLRRHFGAAPPASRALVEECTATIVAEVESLKGLVDEFAQFARMPAPRAVPTNLHALLEEALALYDGLFRSVRIERAFAPALPLVRLDPEQIKRVVVNLVDNALEALGAGGPDGDGTDGDGLIVVGTAYDPGAGVVRLTVADNGPGIRPEDREKLFMPYYSTKRRGSGLGLAIVRRIIVEHGGAIDVGDNPPRGTRFTIELPC
jgi:two-component system nitrogen regulation sensor histidine kinase NtrY